MAQDADPKTPAWLDASLAAEALSEPVRQVRVRPLGAAGDNFASTMFLLNADTEAEEVRTLVVKCIPATETLRESFRYSGLFPRETLMLRRLLPAMQALLEAATPGPAAPLGPRCLLHGDAPDEFLVMEDLGARGFRVGDRVRGLGLRHALLALRALARLHAASAALLARDPAAAEELANPWKTNAEDPFNIVIKATFTQLADVCGDWPELPGNFPAYLRRIKSKAYKKFAEINTPKTGDFAAIGHGDFWTNNIMFRYEDGVPAEVRIIDFQLSHVVSPVVDLLFFLYTSLSDDVSERHVDLLLRKYHAALMQTLEDLGMEAPPLEALLRDMDARGFFALFGAILNLPFGRAPKGHAPQMDKIMEGEGGLEANVFSSPWSRRWLTRVLLDFRRKGWLHEEDL